MIWSRGRRLVEKAWHRAPADNVEELVSRVQRRPRDWWRTRYTTWNHLPYYLQMFERVTNREGLGPWTVRGKRVLELGCGPVLGFLPLLLIEGAERVAAAEPALTNPAASPDFQRSYLRGAWQMHGAACATALTFEELTARLRDLDARPDAPAFEAAGARFDLTVSKSCLEHVRDLPATVRALRAVSAEGSLQAHYVDFTLHWQVSRRTGPFGDLYEHARAASPEGYGQPHGHLNLLRVDEVEAEFRRHFERVVVLPLQRCDVVEVPHADWQGSARSALEVQNALVLAR